MSVAILYIKIYIFSYKARITKNCNIKYTQKWNATSRSGSTNSTINRNINKGKEKWNRS